MLFHSYEYLLFFLPLVWVLYLLLRHTALRLVLLTVSGYVFYAWGQPWIAILLFCSSTADFFIGLRLQQAKSDRARKTWVILSLIFNLGLLGIFKYSGWLFANLNLLFAHIAPNWHLPVLDLPLPPGISFYTFQSLAYILDIYRRKLHAHKRLLDYWAFVAFFPQLFAGPIERAGQLLPQIIHPPRIHPRMVESGLFMILWGLFKKLVVADNMNNLTEVCKANAAVPGAGVMLVLAFTFQIYADFSGYTDIARGSARLFGIKLRRNFLTPYFARSPSDFWQRWHISLSSWLRDYLYLSLGGNRHGKLRTLFNLMLTMLLAGLWHGAGWFFIVWGLYQGALLVFYRVWPLDEWLERAWGRAGRALSILVMFAFTSFGWMLFYLGSYGHFRKAFLPIHPQPPTASFLALAYGVLLFAAPLIITDLAAYRKRREFSDLWQHFSPVAKTGLYLALFYGLLMFGSRDSHEFIYFHF